jgi:hypothetical protein
VDEEESELMASTLLRATVQIDAPMRRRIVPRIAKHVEITKKKVCLTTPLSKPSLGQQREVNERDGTDVARAKTAKRVPNSNNQ